MRFLCYHTRRSRRVWAQFRHPKLPVWGLRSALVWVHPAWEPSCTLQEWALIHMPMYRQPEWVRCTQQEYGQRDPHWWPTTGHWMAFRGSLNLRPIHCCQCAPSRKCRVCERMGSSCCRQKKCRQYKNN